MFFQEVTREIYTRKIIMKKLLFALLIASTTHAYAQNWHVSTEPLFYAAKAPNVALDYVIQPSLSIGFQYSAIEWGEGGRNLSGLQAFYSRTDRITDDAEVLKLYVGLLSANTTLLGIETRDKPKPVYEILYGYRWKISDRFTVTILAGTWFTSEKIYPAFSVPIGYIF
jgi:hypothetical protein